MTDKHLSELTFAELQLLPSVMQGVVDAGFERCTPIQAQTLPLALQGRDVAGQAQTGTGKTAAFLITALSHILRNPLEGARKPGAPRVLILAPTRELAEQIHVAIGEMGQKTPLKSCTVYGGVNINRVLAMHAGLATPLRALLRTA